MAVHGGNTEEIARKYKLNPSEIIYLTWDIRYFGACNGVIACSVFADMWYEYWCKFSG